MTTPTGPRIVLVGGASAHWTPRLVCDFLNTPALAGAEVVLHDIARDRLEAMAQVCTHLADLRAAPMRVRAEPDRRVAFAGADFVVVALSVGGFDSMRHDLEIPERFGIRQPIGDSVGPGGLSRALRSIPVLLEIAADVETVAPNAWFLNVTNPLTALTRAVTSETGLPAVGLRNELIGTQFVLSLLTGAPMHEIVPTVAGVNHFPVFTGLRIGDRDGFAVVRDILDDLDGVGREEVWMTPPEGLHWHKDTPGPWTRADVAASMPVKLEVLRRFGVLPGAHDSHVAEFMPGFVSEANDHGAGWRIHHYGLSGHMADSEGDLADVAQLASATEVSRMPSGEIVAGVIDGLVTGVARDLPVNMANRGQVTTLPPDVVVETMATIDAAGVNPRDVAAIPGIVGEWVRRVSAAQELTVRAALSGDRNDALAAMLADPMAARLPFEKVDAMTSALLESTGRWLPQFQ